MLDSPIQEIKDKLPVTEVLGDYMQLKKAGTNFKGVCPFHSEKTPSFMVSPAKQIWHCFGCGLGGDIFEFIKQIENVDFPEALKILADRAHVELKKPTAEQIKVEQKKADLYEINKSAADYYAKVLWESESAKPALDYLRKRGLSDQTIKNWNLGYAPDDFHYLENYLAKTYDKRDIEQAGLIINKDNTNNYFDRFRGRIMFPIVNYHGLTVGFTGRLLVEQKDAGKYVNSPETPIYSKSKIIYGLYQAKNSIRKNDKCIVVEGNMDVISSHQAGFTNTVASSGTAATEEQFNILSRLTQNLVFAFDSDSAGSIATKRALEQALTMGFNVKIVEMNDSKDPDELIKRGIGLWQKAVDSAPNYVEYFFNKLFKEIDSKSVEGKREITKELAPLIYRVTDPVTKAHFVRKLSQGIDVAESAVWDVINRINLPKVVKTAKPEQHRDKQQTLEEALLGLSVNLKTKESLSNFKPEDFTDNNRKIFTAIAQSEAISLERLIKEHPGLTDQLNLLTFSASIQMQEQNLVPEQEITRAANELKKYILRKQMEEVSQKLSEAEKSKNKDELIRLSQEFTILTNQISQLK